MDWSLYSSQYAAAIIAFYCVYLFGLKARRYHSGAHFQALALAEYFSHGIFLGIALLHLLPEAYGDLQPFLGGRTLSILISLALATLLFMLICEKGITYLISVKEKKSQHWLAYWILTLLCLHALIEGFALGLSDNYTH
jgi:zinc transporter ZupT